VSTLDGGIIEDLDLEIYHSGNHGFVGSSRLRDFVVNGEAFFHQRYVLGTLAKPETKALTFGQAFEDLVQRGEEYVYAKYAVRPAHLGNGNTKAAKEWAAANAHKPRLTDDEIETARAMLVTLQTCAKGMTLIQGCQQQVTLRGHVHGLAMQSRPDYLRLNEYNAYSVDLKTTDSMNDFLGRGHPAIWKYGYHIQAAIVRQLLAANGYPNASCYLFVVEKTGAYRRACIQVPAEYLAWGDEYLKEHAPRLAHCILHDEWPLGPEEIVQLTMPAWAQPRTGLEEVSP
jgi:hypothetical protein